jgi:hypothetical protein
MAQIKLYKSFLSLLKQKYLGKPFLIRDVDHGSSERYVPYNTHYYQLATVTDIVKRNYSYILDFKNREFNYYYSRTLDVFREELSYRPDYAWILPYEEDLIAVMDYNTMRQAVFKGKVYSRTCKQYEDGVLSFCNIYNKDTGIIKEYKSYEVMWPREKKKKHEEATNIV